MLRVAVAPLWMGDCQWWAIDRIRIERHTTHPFPCLLLVCSATIRPGHLLSGSHSRSCQAEPASRAALLLSPLPSPSPRFAFSLSLSHHHNHFISRTSHQVPKRPSSRNRPHTPLRPLSLLLYSCHCYYPRRIHHRAPASRDSRTSTQTILHRLRI